MTLQKCNMLSNFLIHTPLGQMLAVADEEVLHVLEFVEGKKRKVPRGEVMGKTRPIREVEEELEGYFAGKVKEFRVPLRIEGTLFQKRVWEELRKIPMGEVRSYEEVAVAMGEPRACRAVALANAANRFAIVIPCHRVINKSGKVGGYGGEVWRKEWLLKHEK